VTGQSVETRDIALLGESEKQIAASFSEGTLVIIPSQAIDTMNLSSMSRLASVAQNNLPNETTK
jgi:hypothetical protein